MSYRVLAPYVVAPDEDGVLHEYYQGAVAEAVSADAAARLVKDGFLEKVKAAPAKKAAAAKAAPKKPAGKSDDDDAPADLPALVAPDEDWIIYAVTQGLSEDEARELGKAELVARFTK